MTYPEQATICIRKKTKDRLRATLLKEGYMGYNVGWDLAFQKLITEAGLEIKDIGESTDSSS